MKLNIIRFGYCFQEVRESIGDVIYICDMYSVYM